MCIRTEKCLQKEDSDPHENCSSQRRDRDPDGPDHEY
jgi:hypothetical protein